MKKSWLVTLIAVLLAGTNAWAQKKSASSASTGYGTGIGLRAGGYSSGLTVKHFLSGKNGVAVEGLVTTEYKARGARLTVLLEKQNPIKDIKGLAYYYGAGAHAGAYRGSYYYREVRYYKQKGRTYYYTRYYDDDARYIALGADLVLGLEYKMPDLPFVLGVDYKPFFEVFDGNVGVYNDAALSLRFVL